MAPRRPPCLAVLAAVLALAACSDRQEARYPTLGDAARAGAVQRGWIPAWIPESAAEIVDVHDLDTNAQVLRFHAPPDALAAMAAQLTPAALEEAPPLRAHLRAPWGDALREVMNAYAGTPKDQLSFYRAQGAAGSAYWVAVDRGRGVTFAWKRGE